MARKRVVKSLNKTARRKRAPKRKPVAKSGGVHVNVNNVANSAGGSAGGGSLASADPRASYLPAIHQMPALFNQERENQLLDKIQHLNNNVETFKGLLEQQAEADAKRKETPKPVIPLIPKLKKSVRLPPAKKAKEPVAEQMQPEVEAPPLAAAMMPHAANVPETLVPHERDDVPPLMQEMVPVAFPRVPVEPIVEEPPEPLPALIAPPSETQLAIQNELPELMRIEEPPSTFNEFAMTPYEPGSSLGAQSSGRQVVINDKALRDSIKRNQAIDGARGIKSQADRARVQNDDINLTTGAMVKLINKRNRNSRLAGIERESELVPYRAPTVKETKLHPNPVAKKGQKASKKSTAGRHEEIFDKTDPIL